MTGAQTFIMAGTQKLDLRDVTFDIERFYYQEASLIEVGDYKAWSELLTDDIVYVMPQSEFVDRKVNRALDSVGAHSFDENKTSIMNRIGWITGGPTPEIPPPMRRMLITNVRVLNERDDGVEAESKFLLWEMRSTGRSATFIGQRQDVLRRRAEGWQIAHRTVLLASALLPKALTNFF